MSRLVGQLRRLPRWVVTVLVLGLVVIGFVTVVLPLLTSGAAGKPSAEVAGLLPERIQANRPTVLEVAIDNTGQSEISPVCIAARFDRPVAVRYALFQGLDRVGYREGRLCGGRLTAGETISVRIALTVPRPGPLRIDLTPAQGSRRIGPGLAGTVTVTSP